jgi:YebC/PmpR family DNA-binding regulatory protein
VAGHSKWANIKRKKEKEDARRGKAFTKVTRELMVAAREGGGDPNANFRLRLAIERARAVNMPNDNIERAIKRGIGEVEAAKFEETLYEGYGPGGVAIMLEILTDNRNRTAGEIRYLFNKYGGNLGETGCVSWMFDKKGSITVQMGSESEDDFMLAALEAGAEDVVVADGIGQVFTSPEDFQDVRTALAEQGYNIQQAEITNVPQNTVAVAGEEAAQLVKLIEALEDNDDVQEVYANYDIPDEILEQLSS